jgi:hypothetical protein
MPRISELPYKIEVGTIFHHSIKDKFFSQFFKYEVLEVKHGDELHNDQITIETLESPDKNKTTFDVEPMWFTTRKIKLGGITKC